MNRILIGCSLLWLMASCGGQKKQTEGSASENAVEQNDTVMADPSTVNDSLIVVEDFIPAAADESFVDFIYNFASDEDFQLSRIVFPISYYNDSIEQRMIRYSVMTRFILLFSTGKKISNSRKILLPIVYRLTGFILKTVI